MIDEHRPDPADAPVDIEPKLLAFAEGLSEREREVLTDLLLRSLHPLDRIGFTGELATFSESEEEFLRQMESKPRGGGAA